MCKKQYSKILAYGLLALTLHWPTTAMAAAGQWNHASVALQHNSNAAVTGLSSRERSILQATLALKTDRPAQALRLLASAKGDGDPLVALLVAEARRRQAIASARAAGGSDREVRMLASADLNGGLGEADARLNAFMDKLNPVSADPIDILLPGPDVASVFMFDKARNRMFVYQHGKDGKLTKITDEYVVTGSVKGEKQHAGDGRSPDGIYRFSKKLQGKKLQAVYGPMAFPIDYPNALDRLHHKSGSGIWLHGYAVDVSRRPPRDTRGCFSLSNKRLLAMAGHITPGRTWVIVGNNLRFGHPDDKRRLLASVKRAIDAWRHDWASLNSNAYLSHYHPSFHSGKRNLAAWTRYKRRVNASKSFINVSLSDLTLMHDPNRWSEGEVVVAQFVQHYRSSNYADVSHKRLYLVRTDAGSPWKILLEENVKQ